AECGRTEDTAVLDQLGVRSREYFLYVSRLEPENNAHVVIEAFESVQTVLDLLIIGDAPYADAYIQRLKATRDKRIRFPGAIYGAGYRELQSHAYVYIQATEDGRTHPAIVEATAAGNWIISKATPENREILGDAGLFFREAGDLARQIEVTLRDRSVVERFGVLAQTRVTERYSWDAVTDAYEDLFRRLSRP